MSIRIALAFFGGLLFLLGIAFLIEPKWLVERWLWPEAPWISYVFMASIILSFSFGYFLLAIQGKSRPLRNYSIAGVISFGGFALYLISESTLSSTSYDQNRLIFWGEIILVIAIINAIFWAVSENKPFIQKLRIPLLLRWILVVLITANLWVGLRLINTVDAFAWKLTNEMAITYGWALLGAAVLVFFARLEPFWENQWPVFAALVAYDLTLAGPLFYLLINPELVPSVPYRTAIYLIFVIGSLATVIGFRIYYLRKVAKTEHNQ